MLLISPEYFLNYSSYPEVLYLPSGIFKFIPYDWMDLSSNSIHLLTWFFYILGVLSAFRVIAPYSSALFFLYCFGMFNLSYSFGYNPHVYMPIVLASFALIFSPSTSVLMIKTIFCFIFFSAGVSKLLASGTDWIHPEMLESFLLRSQIHYFDMHPLAQKLAISSFIIGHPILIMTLATFSIMLELLSPLALIFKKMVPYIVIGLLFMQIGIYFTILVDFKLYLALYVFWVDWSFLTQIKLRT